MVEVLERMLILAASRLSMIALEKETEMVGSVDGNRAWGGRHGKRGKREKNQHVPPAVYQLQHETKPCCTSTAAGEFCKKSKLFFSAAAQLILYFTSSSAVPPLSFYPESLKEVIYISGARTLASPCFDTW